MTDSGLIGSDRVWRRRMGPMEVPWFEAGSAAAQYQTDGRLNNLSVRFGCLHGHQS